MLKFILGIGFIALMIAFAFTMDKRHEGKGNGIQGWLLLFVANRFLDPFFLLLLFIIEYQWQPFKALMALVFLVMSAISVYNGWCLVKEREWSVVKRTQILLWVNTCMLIGYNITAHGFDARVISSAGGGILSALIWSSYFSKSQRVRNTYNALASGEKP